MRILLVEDERITRLTLAEALERAGHAVVACGNGQEALSLLDEAVDVVLTDLRMPGMDGLELLRRVKARRPGTEVVLMTAYSTVETAVAALKEGAYDYLAKPFATDELLLLLARLAERRSLVAENRRLRRQVGSAAVGRLVGASPAMRRLAETIVAVAEGDYTVLITGESGTGKELVAAAIHAASPRADGPFVKVSCAALGESLLESELFGHEKGAFTGADRRHIGRFERAAGGTLFLDDIDDVPLRLQVKLLRALQEREIERVGGTTVIPVDLRVVAATKVDLRRLVAAGRFREDLYYRLNVVPVALPPLRERREDIPLLVRHFLARYAPDRPALHLTDAALRRLAAWPWPGNVRELENCVQRLVALTRGDVVDEPDLPPEYRGEGPAPATAPPAEGAERIDLEAELARRERELLLWALQVEHGHRGRAAARLGLPRTTFTSKLKKHGIV